MMDKMDRLPRIGVTPDINDLPVPETEYHIRRNYTDAILQNGGLPFILPYSGDVGAYLAAIDGLLVTGGMFDIDPGLYGQSARKPLVTKPDRTSFEKALIDGALHRRMPVLGICNGMQLLAVCLGGQLIQDIPGDIEAAYEHRPDQAATVPHHAIEMTGSPHAIPAVWAASYTVNSVHHQAVRPSEAYRAIAVAGDGVIEAIEAVGHDFAVGVQWHPEYAVSAIDALIWRGFVAAAADYASRRATASHA